MQNLSAADDGVKVPPSAVPAMATLPRNPSHAEPDRGQALKTLSALRALS